jgi:Uncharacterized conserved protein
MRRDHALALSSLASSSSAQPAEKDFPVLGAGQLHEIHAACHAMAAAMAFALGIMDHVGGKPILLARCAPRRQPRMRLYGEGLAALGVDPARLLIVETQDERALLQAGLDAARCGGLASVLLETWGALPRYDLTASRRLVLAAERSGTSVIVLRAEAEPRASAAHTRWIVRSAPSSPLAANAPGLPATEAELSRRRGGPSGLRWRLERRKESEGYFHAQRLDAAPLSGAMVSMAGVRASETEEARVLYAFGARLAHQERPAALGGRRRGPAAGPAAGDDAGGRPRTLPLAGEPAARSAGRSA